MLRIAVHGDDIVVYTIDLNEPVRVTTFTRQGTERAKQLFPEI